MLLGLQVLRVHISELCKVKELCRDFSRRYITSLSLKMQGENLLKKGHHKSQLAEGGSSKARLKAIGILTATDPDSDEGVMSKENSAPFQANNEDDCDK